MPFDFQSWVSEGLAVLVDLLKDPLIVHNGRVIVPQQGVLTALLSVVTYFCQVHVEKQLQEKKNATV